MKHRLGGQAEIRSFWDEEYARIKRGAVPVDSDPSLYGLEDRFICRYLARFQPRSLLDVGCGNGRRTAVFADQVEGPVLGIDSSPTAIAYAKELEDSQLSFRLGDFETLERLDRTFDCVLTCRVLINLPTVDLQVQALRALMRPLRAGGLLLMVEASMQGERRLNELRGRFGLPPLGTAWHNRLLDEARVSEVLSESARLLELRRFGFYYVLTRVLHPLVKGSGAGQEEATFRRSAELQEALADGESVEAFGRHLAVAARKLR